MAKNIHLLKKAIFTKLSNDSELTELLGAEGRVFHRQPNKDSQYPCVIYAIINDVDNPYNQNDDSGDITQTFFRITIFTDDSNTEKCDNIESRIKQLLHGQRSLDNESIICYSCFRENLMEPMRDEQTHIWITPSRYKVTWSVK